MSKSSWLLRLAFTLTVCVVAAYMVFPTLVYFGLDGDARSDAQRDSAAFSARLPSWSHENHVVLGLDLQGGVHMVLGVDLAKAVSDKAARIAAGMQDDLQEKQIAASVAHLDDEGSGDRVRVDFSSSAAIRAFDDQLLDTYENLAEVSRSEERIIFRVHPDWVERIERDAVDQTIRTITNRIDKMHVTEPSITKRGKDQVQVQLPGYANPDEAKALIGRTAQLEMQLVDDDADFLSQLALPAWARLEDQVYQRRTGEIGRDRFLSFPADRLSDLRGLLRGKAPDGRVIKYGKLPERAGEPPSMRTYTLVDDVLLTGDDLEAAQVSMGSAEQPQPYVVLELSGSGTRIFADVTSKNVGRRIAIVLEDIVDSAPVINEPITGGTAQIQIGGSRTRDEMLREANDLALVLKSGALPAPVSFREERTVGPSLGQDALEQAAKACFVGGLLVALFMIGIYKLGGGVAILCAMLNVFLVVATLSFFGGTLSLPGIAGLLLTVGMAVDANVIINERIREELRAGKTVRSAVGAGYGSAFTAIFDSNVTTALAGLVCLQFGSGPVQNFATTLLIGIASTMFTAVFVSRVIFDAFTQTARKTLWL